MSSPQQLLTLEPAGRCLTHEEACRLFGQALGHDNAPRVVINLEKTEDATTSAFAQLVLLRRSLLRAGRDLLIRGLHDRVQGVFEVNRLTGVLPVA